MPVSGKKASVETVLLVFLVFFTTSAALFSFIKNSDRVESIIINAKILDEVYDSERIAKFYIADAAENAIFKTYREISGSSQYINPPVKYINNEDPEFSELNSRLDEIFKEKFIDNFKAEFLRYDFSERYLKELQNAVRDNNPEANFDGKSIHIIVEGLEIEKKWDDVEVIYKPEISTSFELGRYGLEGFEDVYNASRECKKRENAEEIESCLEEKLPGFYIDAEEKTRLNRESYFLITLLSKKEFFAGNSFERIKFSFVPA